MTATIDPTAAIATAVQDFLESARELAAQDTDDPTVLDEFSRLLGRARRKVNTARKHETPAAEVPTMPALVPVPDPEEQAPPLDRSVEAPTVPAFAPVTDRPRHAKPEPPRGRHRRARTRPPWVRLLVVLLVVAGAGVAVTGSPLYGWLAAPLALIGYVPVRVARARWRRAAAA